MIDSERYGGRRAHLVYLIEQMKGFAGAYSSLTKIDWKSVERLVFICKGNICRSPYAAARARVLGMNAVSCGLEARDGTAADLSAARNAALRGMDLSGHRSMKLCSLEIRPGDLLLFFESHHLAAYRTSSNYVAVSLLGLWAPTRRPYIADPYGKSDRYFQECFSVIDSALGKISENMLSRR